MRFKSVELAFGQQNPKIELLFKLCGPEHHEYV